MISAVVPSEYVPTASNCCVAPVARIAGVAGVTAMEDNVTAATTGNATEELVTPSKAAVILAVPAATPVATPLESIVAAAVLELVQFAS